MADLHKQVLGSHFKVFKNQMEFLSQVCGAYVSEHKKSPFEMNTDTASCVSTDIESVAPILPLVDYDEFEASLGTVMTEAGGLISSAAAEELAGMLDKYDMTPSRRALVVEILKSTRNAAAISAFNQSGGLTHVVNWLQITSSDLKDGVDLTLLEHTLEWLVSPGCQIESKADRQIATFIEEVAQRSARLMSSARFPSVVGFDHLAAGKGRIGTIEALRENIQQHYKDLLSKLQNRLPMKPLSAGSVTSSGGKGAGSTTTTGVKGGSEKKGKYPSSTSESVEASTVPAWRAKRALNTSQQQQDERSKRARDAPPAPSPATSAAYGGGGSASQPVSNKNVDMLSKFLASEGTSRPPGTSAREKEQGRPLMTVPPRSNTIVMVDSGEKVERGVLEQPAVKSPGQNQGDGKEISFSSFSGSGKDKGGSVEDDTAHNAKRRKIKWADESAGGMLSDVLEFESLPPYEAPVNVLPSGPTMELAGVEEETKQQEQVSVPPIEDEDDEEQKYYAVVGATSSSVTSTGGDGKSASGEKMSYSMLRKREIQAERQSVKYTQQVAERMRMEQLLSSAARMSPTIPWTAPSLSRKESETRAESRECKIQTQRLNKRTEAVFSSEDAIPKDPDPCTVLRAAEDRPPLAIPWDDKEAPLSSGPSHVSAPAPSDSTESTPMEVELPPGFEDNTDDDDVVAGLSALPEYVKLLTEDELGVLVERLSDEKYAHLIENTSDPGFLDLVEEIAPGTTVKYLQGMSAPPASHPAPENNRGYNNRLQSEQRLPHHYQQQSYDPMYSRDYDVPPPGPGYYPPQGGPVSHQTHTPYYGSVAHQPQSHGYQHHQPYGLQSQVHYGAGGRVGKRGGRSGRGSGRFRQQRQY
mmetsp:Transcript_9268/g.13961  ORF Transcript_9268/g.13961 Transcript_9268/m.13961 type:complete len:867 (-) Transcript_9268:134-2734(-)